VRHEKIQKLLDFFAGDYRNWYINLYLQQLLVRIPLQRSGSSVLEEKKLIQKEVIWLQGHGHGDFVTEGLIATR
jgi:hypothetical protein